MWDLIVLDFKYKYISYFVLIFRMAVSNSIFSIVILWTLDYSRYDAHRGVLLHALHAHLLDHNSLYVHSSCRLLPFQSMEHRLQFHNFSSINRSIIFNFQQICTSMQKHLVQHFQADMLTCTSMQKHLVQYFQADMLTAPYTLTL